MRITLLGAFGIVAVAALLVCIGYDLGRRNRGNTQPPQNPQPPLPGTSW